MFFWLSCIKSKHIYIYFKSERIEIEIDNNNSSFEESFDMAEPQEILEKRRSKWSKILIQKLSLIIFINHYCHQRKKRTRKTKLRLIIAIVIMEIYTSRYNLFFSISSKTLARNYKT